jgi:hypothetical protein
MHKPLPHKPLPHKPLPHLQYQLDAAKNLKI